MSETASRRRWRAHLHRHRAGADAAENLPRQTVRHHAARRCVEHQRRGVGGGEAVVEPVQAEVGDRRHVDQHFGDHHEQDRQHQELAGQAKPRSGRRRAWPPGSGRRGCCLGLCHRIVRDRHPRRRSTFRRRRTHDDRQFGREEGDRGALADLRIGRIGHHQLGKSPDVEAVVDGECPGADLLAGRGADDGCAEDQSLRVGHHLDMAARLALGLGAVVVVVGPAQQPDVAVLLARLAPRSGRHGRVPAR